MSEVSTKKRIIVLIISLAVISGITALAPLVRLIEIMWLRLVMMCVLNLCNGAVALGAMKLTGMKIDFDFKNYKQYIIGVSIALILSLCIGFIPALFGGSLVGGHTDFVPWKFAYQMFFYLVIIGPVEELIFRVYVQDTLGYVFLANDWISVIVSSALFGLWHIINGSFIQVLFTFGIGLVFGFAKYFLKNCKYVGLALGHGLYDFLNYVITVFVI